MLCTRLTIMALLPQFEGWLSAGSMDVHVCFEGTLCRSTNMPESLWMWVFLFSRVPIAGWLQEKLEGKPPVWGPPLLAHTHIVMAPQTFFSELHRICEAP